MFKININMGGFGKNNQGHGRHNEPLPPPPHHGEHQHHHEHHGPHQQRGPQVEYFAAISQSGAGMFISGELIGITFGKANLCRSYDECIGELTKKLNEEIESCKRFNKPLPMKTTYQEAQQRHPGKEIVAIYPKGEISSRGRF